MTYLTNVRLETNFAKDVHELTITESELVTLEISEGKIKQILPQNGQEPTVSGTDMKGWLAVPSLKDMHNHLDKTYMPLGWRSSIPVKSLRERLVTEENELTMMAPSAKLRAQTMIKHLMSYGVTHIRTHVNIDPFVGLTNFYGVKEALEEVKDQLTYEIVAFPQHGYFLENTPELMEQALQEGADLVGGLDPAGIDFAIEESVAEMVRLSVKYQKGIDFHLHDGGSVGVYTVETLLDELERQNCTEEVAISHAFCLAIASPAQRKQLFTRLKEHNVKVMSTMPYDISDRMPPLDELREMGIFVGTGCDGFFDAWSSYVAGDGLEKIHSFCDATGKITEEDLSRAYTFACGVENPLTFETKHYWFNEGDRADILFVPSQSTAHLVARKPIERKLLANGNWVQATRKDRY